MAATSIKVSVKRQDKEDSSSYWEEFELPYQAGMNVISVLMEIRKTPKTTAGKATTPVNWDYGCMEEVCGSCTMIINGRVRQACSALVDKLEQPIRLEPMTKFPVMRDLVVSRNRMFEALKKVKAWIPIDGTYDLGPGPKQDPNVQGVAYQLSECMSCGCCLEACPQYTKDNNFVGAAAISQARLFNLHPTGKHHAHERVEALMDEGGIADCGLAQNCVKACPKKIPLTDSIAEMMRQATKQLFTGFFRK